MVYAIIYVVLEPSELLTLLAYSKGHRVLDISLYNNK